MSRWTVPALGLEAVALAALLALSLDLYAHKRVERLGGVNIWGYRGPVMPQKRPNEIRLAFVGGSFAFGWGVAASETMPPTVRQLVSSVLDRPGRSPTLVTAVNLGALGLPMRDYAARVKQFGYLKPDVIGIYAAVGEPGDGVHLPPADSAITTMTSYVPMLPLVLEEKGSVLAARGRRLAGSILMHTGRVLRSQDAWIYRAFFNRQAERALDEVSALEEAVDAALGLAPGVVVMMSVPGTARQHVATQSILERLASRHRTEPRVRFVDLGRDPVLYEQRLRLDGVNFSVAGHARVAEQIAPVVLDLVTRRTGSS